MGTKTSCKYGDNFIFRGEITPIINLFKAIYIMASQPTPPLTYPPRNKCLIAEPMGFHKPLIRPAISGGGTWPGGGTLTIAMIIGVKNPFATL